MGRAKRPDIPSGKLSLSFTTLGKHTVLHRIHPNRFGPVQFNDSGLGDARFSPLKGAEGEIVPTLYTGSTFHCAAMETLFHEVPYTAGLKVMQKAEVAGYAHSTIRLKADLQLVGLSAKALRKLGVERAQLIDTYSQDYPYTREWARAIHAYAKDAQGLRWISRQDDTAEAIMLFGDRVKPRHLEVAGPSHDVTRNTATYDEVVRLAAVIGVQLFEE